MQKAKRPGKNINSPAEHPDQGFKGFSSGLSKLLLTGLFCLGWLVLLAAGQLQTPPLAPTETYIPTAAPTALPPVTLLPAATPVPYLPPDLQETVDWALGFIQQRGPWLFLRLLLAALVLWLLWQGLRWLVGSRTRQLPQALGMVGEDATHRYLEKVIEDFRKLRFRGLDERSRSNRTMELDDAFISQRMMAEAERESEKKKTGRRDKQEQGGLPGHPGSDEAGQPVNLVEAIRLSDRLAIVGAAGSGKSTLLQWAGLAQARSRVAKHDLSDEMRLFVQAAGDRQLIPIYLPLRSFNRHCLDKGLNRTAGTLLDYIACYVVENHPGLELPQDFFRRHLRQTGCLVMLDGVDEVPPDDRRHVREAIDALVSEFKEQPRNRYLVTSRSAAYFGPYEATGFRRCQVQNLAPEERDRLIRKWCAYVYEGDEGVNQADDLIRRLGLSDQRVRDLAITPLMVTIFALVHYDLHDLPRLRAELYEHAVRILLTGPYIEGEAAADLRRDWQLRRHRLSFIAFQMHAHAAAELPEDELVELIWKEYGSAEQEKAARQAAGEFLQRVADRGGLLEEENRRYGFYTHRTFREFLAGRYLADEMSPDEQQDFLNVRLDDDTWLEPVRLAAGYLAIHSERPADEFVRRLAALGETGEERAQALALAGWALGDLPQPAPGEAPSPRRQETTQLITSESLQRIQVNPPVLTARLRSQLGLALGWAGDPRFAPAWFTLDGERVQAILPERELVAIPAGSFQMGTSREQEQRLQEQNTKVYVGEKPGHPVEITYEYQIGRYPVTNTEFRLFWQARGYERLDEFWSEEGRAWQSDLEIYPENVRDDIRRWLERRPVAQRGQPFFWDDPELNGPNQPVVGVCWFEAQAYCSWLRAVTGKTFRLPTEAEWEKAARWRPVDGASLLWPWGGEWDASRCNNKEPEDALKSTSPVGIYPHGDSPRGCADMAGNVWEWCQDWYAQGEYERREKTGAPVVDPAGPEAGVARVVRGGSWLDYRSRARCAARRRFGPVHFFSSLGFRLVLSPSSS